MRRQRREVLLKRSRSLFDTRRHRRHPDPPPPLGSDFLENLTDLLNDDDEQVMEEEAIAQGKVPVSSACPVIHPRTYSYPGWP